MSGVEAAVAVAATLLAAWLLAVALVWLHRPSRELALPALRLLPDVLRLARRIAADAETPVAVRVALVGLGLWIASPIDLLPEFLPGIGPLDDLVVAAVVLRWTGRRLGRDALARHWSGPPEGFALLVRLLGLPAGDETGLRYPRRASSTTTWSARDDDRRDISPR